MIQGMGNFNYPERLRQLELPTLAYRRNRGDMILTYKLLSGLYDEQVTLHLDIATIMSIGQHHITLHYIESYLECPKSLRTARTLYEIKGVMWEYSYVRKHLEKR